ncbi:MAG: UDP-glucose/GDP-mannose dehydrogenase family protein [DPANN group archaeon]|nr:UDP-glucose/GDP-mannose dehydrogenase family protein [DPANN group archaeon]
MDIAVIGTGYVGLVAGTCLAKLGNTIWNVDVDEAKIAKLRKGEMPIYEPGIADVMRLNVKEHRQFFSTDIKEAVEKAEVIFIAVGTPQSDDGQADLRYVLQVARDIGRYMNGYKVIVDKSTVPIGTADHVKATIKEHQQHPHLFDMVSNPEFLREGQALHDFMQPDRIVLGVESEKAKNVMYRIYRGIERTGKPILFTDIKSAEMIKYASNAMLATRISFMNMLSPLCEKVGADVKMVAKGMGLDSRIGPRFLQAGIGYGGSCFPKDVRAMMHSLKAEGCDASLLDAVDSINDRVRAAFVQKVKDHYGSLKGLTFGAWGLAFKPNTDDMREAPSITIIRALQKEGASFVAFDPVAQETASKVLDDLSFVDNPYDAAKGVDGLILFTDWDQFRQLDMMKIKSSMKQPVLFDGRNVFDPHVMKENGFVYYGTGR